MADDFCRACGAGIPPRDGEGTCGTCDPRPGAATRHGMAYAEYDAAGHPTAEALLAAWLDWFDHGLNMHLAPAGMTRLHLARGYPCTTACAICAMASRVV